MRKNYYLIDVVTKARCFGFTEEEIKQATKEGLENYKRLKESIEKQEKKK